MLLVDIWRSFVSKLADSVETIVVLQQEHVLLGIAGIRLVTYQ